jgi:hypothetical protein
VHLERRTGLVEKSGFDESERDDGFLPPGIKTNMVPRQLLPGLHIIKRVTG